MTGVRESGHGGFSGGFEPKPRQLQPAPSVNALPAAQQCSAYSPTLSVLDQCQQAESRSRRAGCMDITPPSTSNFPTSTTRTDNVLQFEQSSSVGYVPCVTTDEAYLTEELLYPLSLTFSDLLEVGLGDWSWFHLRLVGPQVPSRSLPSKPVFGLFMSTGKVVESTGCQAAP